MAKKRRRKNQPNLPDDVLARARQQAGLEDDNSSNDDDSDDMSVNERAARRRNTVTPVQIERSRKRGELTNDMVSEVLSNPTKIVTEEEMREEYQHVIYDLRNMGILAAILIVVLVGVAFVLPTF